MARPRKPKTPRQTSSDKEVIAFLRAALEKARKDHEKELADAKERLEEKDREIARLKRALLAQEKLTGNATILKMSVAALVAQNPDIPQARLDFLNSILPELDRELQSALLQKNFLNYLMQVSRVGSENLDNLLEAAKKQNKQATTELDDKLKKTNASIENQERQSRKADQANAKALNDLKNAPEPLDNALTAAHGIHTAEVPPKTKAPVAKTGKKTRGRVVPQKKLDKVPLGTAEFSPECTLCENGKAVVVLDWREGFLRVMTASFGDLLKEGMQRYPIVYCPDCRKVYAARPPEMPVPYSLNPSCATSSDIAIEVANLMASGLSGKRSEDLLSNSDIPQLASEKFTRPAAAWLSEGGIGNLLLKQHLKVAQDATRIGADETKIDVLKKESSGAAHILSCCSALNDPKQFAIFQYMPSRNSEEIRKALQGWKFEVLNRDGYAGYNGAFKQMGRNEQIVSQVCLIHARRKFCLAMEIDDLYGNPNEDDMLEEIKRRFKTHDPQFFVLSILQGLSKIYAWEKQSARLEGETDEMLESRIRAYRKAHCTPLMNHIDTLVNELAAKHAVLTNKGWVTRTAGLIDKAVVFWLNNQSDLRTFLTDPKIAPDTNNVERSIRAIAVYKNVAFFKASEEGVKAFCVALSLRETAKTNSIKNPVRWMTKFHRAFFEHVESRMLTERFVRLKRDPKTGEIAEGERLMLTAKTLDPEYYKDFDFEPWLAWNYVKTEE